MVIWDEQQPEQRQAFGIYDNLIRMAVGIEDPEDLVEDLARALESTKQ